MKNGLIGIVFLIGIIATAHARDLSEIDLPKIFAVRNGVGFTRDYRGKNITLKAKLSATWAPASKQFIRFIVDLRLDGEYLAYCDVSPENSIKYDQLRRGDAVTMQGTINELNPGNDKDGPTPVLALKAYGCSITRR